MKTKRNMSIFSHAVSKNRVSYGIIMIVLKNF